MGLASLPPLGAMVETPSAALSVGAMVKHADFLSVGTNDLTQYTLAAGRENDRVSQYFLDSHASVMRLLGIILDECGSTPVSICGELAENEDALTELLRLGFRELSVSPPRIPFIKEAVRNAAVCRT
jgi:phosphotransferase system enzyme I (PtsI)